MSYYVSVLKKYAVFNGRARRKEYWMFGLFNAIFLIIGTILDTIIFLHPYGIISAVYGLAC